MKRLFLLWLFIVSMGFSYAIYAELPQNYQDLSAEEKQTLLWSEITNSNAEERWPKLSGNSIKEVLLKLKGLFNLRPTFDHLSDEVPAGRVKIIHTNGSVGKISFIPAPGHPFTGIYQTGGIGLARLSLATTPSDVSYTPGLAVKFLIPKHPSLNLQVMNNVDGQGGNWNYFAMDFSNQIPHASSWTLKAIEKIFEFTKKPANNLPISHLASWNELGEKIENPTSPEKLTFKPSPRVKNFILEDSRVDFRVSLSQIGFGAIYDVYGDFQGKEYYIGTLVLESQLLASNYGDKKLFFQHQR